MPALAVHQMDSGGFHEECNFIVGVAGIRITSVLYLPYFHPFSSSYATLLFQSLSPSFSSILPVAAQVVREMSLSPEERAKLEEKRAAERAAEAEKLKPAEAIAAIPEENSGTTNSIHSESYNSAGSGAGLGTEVPPPPPPPPPPLQPEAAAKDGPPAGEANSFLSILASFG